MAFLDKEGLSHFLAKLKDLFVSKAELRNELKLLEDRLKRIETHAILDSDADVLKNQNGSES